MTFPYGLPETEEDYQHCHMRENGEFIVRRKIGDSQNSSTPTIPEAVDREESKWKMTKETLDKHTWRKLATRDMNAEHFKAKNVYKYNEDGKEHRYFGDKSNSGIGRDWH